MRMAHSHPEAAGRIELQNQSLLEGMAGGEIELGFASLTAFPGWNQLHHHAKIRGGSSGTDEHPDKSQFQ